MRTLNPKDEAMSHSATWLCSIMRKSIFFIYWYMGKFQPMKSPKQRKLNKQASVDGNVNIVAG